MRAAAHPILVAAVALAGAACRSIVGVDEYGFFPECIPASTRACSSSPETAGQGACIPGTQTCTTDGTAWGACEGEIVPARADDCVTGADLDCDGAALAECSGKLAWTRSFDSSGDDAIHGAGMDADDRVLVAGRYGGALTLGGESLPQASPAGAVRAAFERDGDLAWVVGQAGPVESIDPFATEIRAHVALTVGGGDAFTLLVTKSPDDQSLEKLHADTGVGAWLLGGIPLVAVAPAKLAAGDFVWIATTTGAAAQTVIDFAGAAGTSAVTARGGGDVVLASFDATGTFVDAALYGDAATQVARDVAIDEDGYVVVAACFTGKIDLGCGSHAAPGMSRYDAIVARMSPEGTCLADRVVPLSAEKVEECWITARAARDGVSWAARDSLPSGVAGSVHFGRAGVDLTGGWEASYEGAALAGSTSWCTMAIDPFGNHLVALGFEGTLTVDGVDLPAVGTTRSTAVLKLAAADGHIVWGTVLGSDDDLVAASIATGDAGDVVVAGSFTGTLGTGPPASMSSQTGAFVALLEP